MNGSIVREIAKTRVDPGQIAIWALGGPSLAFESAEVTGFVDPFFSNWSNSEWIRRFPPLIDPRMVRHCDLILITHEHEDHCDPTTIKGLYSNSSPRVLAPRPAVARLEASDEFDESLPRTRVVRPDEKLRVGDLAIEVVETEDPLSSGAVGYLVKTTAACVLFLGDSLFSESLLERLAGRAAIDAVFVAVGANPPRERYYFSIEELLEAARILYPSLVVPIHWDLWTKTYIDPKPLITREHRNIVILKHGEVLLLPSKGWRTPETAERARDHGSN